MPAQTSSSRCPARHTYTYRGIREEIHKDNIYSFVTTCRVYIVVCIYRCISDHHIYSVVRGRNGAPCCRRESGGGVKRASERASADCRAVAGRHRRHVEWPPVRREERREKSYAKPSGREASSPSPPPPSCVRSPVSWPRRLGLYVCHKNSSCNPRNRRVPQCVCVCGAFAIRGSRARKVRE